MKGKFFILAISLIFNILFSTESIENLLIGAEDGLYIKNPSGFEKLELLSGKKIIKIEKSKYGYYFLCEDGIAFSSNLTDIEWLTNGIKSRKIIVEEDGYFAVKEILTPFNNIKIDEQNPKNLIVFNKKEIYISTNYGRKWSKLNIPLGEFNSAEISSFGKTIWVYFTHPYRGVYFKNLSTGQFVNISRGIEKINSFYEDLSDINFHNGKLYTVSSFKMDIYRFDAETKNWEIITNFYNSIGMVYGFDICKDEFLFVTDYSIKSYTNDNIYDFELLFETLSYFINEKGKIPCSLLLNEEFKLSSVDVLFSEYNVSSNFIKAMDKKGVYFSPYSLRNKKNKSEYIISTLEKKGCNAVVIDMKDDFGYLHFLPENPEINKIARISSSIDIKKLVNLARSNDIYLIARIVVFKDPVLYRYNNGEFAVKDKTTKLPWVGLKTNSDSEELTTNAIKEYWVDPYNPNVWKYNVDIACELVRRGFDEIQFDYIRFPTDGLNLTLAYYPAKPEGVSKDEALYSFLRYARKRIEAPISIDIYGANGWYRTAARTGQDVESIYKYVDVICPMFYPSHFCQDFMNFEPYEERPFRIYYYGTYRTYFMARKKVIIRPYLQHFKLNVSYDRAYYNENYISNEIRGVEEGLNMGYTFWNIEGKY